MAARLFQLGLLVSPVLSFPGRFLSWLGNVSSVLGEIFTVFVLHLDDFFIVGDVSWIRHPTSYSISRE